MSMNYGFIYEFKMILYEISSRTHVFTKTLNLTYEMGLLFMSECL